MPAHAVGKPVADRHGMLPHGYALGHPTCAVDGSVPVLLSSVTNQSDAGSGGHVRQRLDSVAGVRGLELGNVAFRNAGPNCLVFQNIFVLETFRENCERADRRKSLGCLLSSG